MLAVFQNIKNSFVNMYMYYLFNLIKNLLKCKHYDESGTSFYWGLLLSSLRWFPGNRSQLAHDGHVESFRFCGGEFVLIWLLLVRVPVYLFALSTELFAGFVLS